VRRPHPRGAFPQVRRSRAGRTEAQRARSPQTVRNSSARGAHRGWRGCVHRPARQRRVSPRLHGRWGRARQRGTSVSWSARAASSCSSTCRPCSTPVGIGPAGL